jgi:HlyD family secretion protein
VTKRLALVIVALLGFSMPIASVAAPLILPLGSAQATLQFSPDPPTVGKVHAVLSLTGASADQLAHTRASFGTVMPTMSMNGPSGAARQTGSGRWEFDAMLGMAAAWDVRVQFTGAISGAVTYHIEVGNHSAPQSESAAKTSVAVRGDATGGMAMGNPSSESWKTAAIALGVIVMIGAVAFGLRRRTAPLFTSLAVAGLVVVGFAFAQDRFYHANPAASMSGLTSDMSSMSDVHGTAPIPITVARVTATEGADPNISAPGSVQPYLTQDIVARTSGLLTDFTAYAGDRVSAGQTIARLDEPELGSRARAAAADAAAQRAAAQGAGIDARHHAPNGVVIARNESSSMQRELDAARNDVTAKAERVRYWQAELEREHQLLRAGAVSEQEYGDERAQASTAASEAAAARDRVASLVAQVRSSQTKIGDAQANVEIMDAKAAEMRARADQATASAASEATMAQYRDVVAPSDGVIVKRLIDPGVFVQSGTVIARVAVIDRLRIQANVSQDRLSGISVGTPLQSTLPDGHVLRGRVSSISPVADATTHTTTVEAIVENPKSALVPGGFVNVVFHATGVAKRGTIDVPSAALVGSGNAAAVWEIVNGEAHRVPVRSVSDDGTTATVTGTLSAGARVAVEGASTLEEGQVVEPRGT